MANFETISWIDFDRMFKERTGCNFTDVENLSPTMSCMIESWSTHSDKYLFDKVLKIVKNKKGTILVVSELSFLKNMGAFLLRDNNAEKFVDDYFNCFGESLFNGDTYFVFYEANVVVCFHHSGYLFLYNANH